MRNFTNLKSNYYSLVFLLVAFFGYAQQGEIDLNFGHPVLQVGDSTRFNNVVRTIVIQPDQKILIGGNFTSYNGVTRNKIVRLNTDGNYDPTFAVATGFSAGMVKVLTLQSDGKILAGGTFTTYNSQPRVGIVRINSDGSLDSSFAIGTGFNSGSSINSILVLSSGKIIVGGTFTSYNGTNINRILGMNSDGSIDSGFNVGTGADGEVFSIVYDALSQKILAGGSFTTYNAVSKKKLVRLNENGTIDNTLAIGTGFNGGIFKVLPLSNGKIIVVGNFDSYNGESNINRIIRLNSNGTKDATFVIGTGLSGYVYDVIEDASGNVIATGNFITYNGVTKNRIVRITNTGDLDMTFKSGYGLSAEGYTLALQSNGKLFCGGDFIQHNRTLRTRIVKLNTDGTLDNIFNKTFGFNNNVIAVHAQSDGKVLVGGNFDRFNDESNNSFIRLNASGMKDETFTTGALSYLEVVSDIIEDVPNNKIYIGGEFSTYQGVARTNLARLNADGTLDISMSTGSGFAGPVKRMELQSDGKIIVAGNFTAYDGIPKNRIVRLENNGTLDLSFNIGSGFNGMVNAIKLQSDGKILVGGTFSTFNGNAVQRLVRLNSDGTIDVSFQCEEPFSSAVLDIIVQPNGKILVGGGFNASLGGGGVIRLESNGAIDTTFTAGFGINSMTVYKMSLHSSGKLFIAGSLPYNGNYATGIAKLTSTGSLDTSFSTGLGFLDAFGNGAPRTIVIQNDGTILAGGSFIKYGDHFISGLVRLKDETLSTQNGAFEKEALKIYPNPAIDFITIASLDPVIKCNIYDLNGRAFEPKLTESRLEVSFLERGLYMLSVTTQKGTQQLKFIKN